MKSTASLALNDDPSPRGSYFSRTTDGGVTWSPPKLVLWAPDAAHFVTELFVLPSGALVAVFGKLRLSGLANPAQGNPVLVIRSTDKGDTWSQPVQAARDYPNATRDRDTGSEKNDAGEQPIGALGPDGTIYVLVQDNRSQSDSGILMVRPSDEGRTWSQPQQMTTGSPRGRSRRPRVLATARAITGEMVAFPNGSGAAFFMGRKQARQGPSDIFFGRINVSASKNPQSCLARRSPVGSRNIGRIRIGLTRRRLLGLPVKPARRTPRTYRYCVKGSRRWVVAVFSSRSRRARARLVTTHRRGGPAALAQPACPAALPAGGTPGALTRLVR